METKGRATASDNSTELSDLWLYRQGKFINKSQRQHKFANAVAVFESSMTLANNITWPPHLSLCGVHVEQHECAVDRFEVENNNFIEI
jgi:hypothetical protein